MMIEEIYLAGVLLDMTFLSKLLNVLYGRMPFNNVYFPHISIDHI